MRRPLLVTLCVAAAAAAAAAAATLPAEHANNVISTDDLLWEVAEECMGAPKGMRCLRRRVLAFLRAADSAEQVSGARSEAGAVESGSEESEAAMDAEILSRALSYARSHAFRLQLPAWPFYGLTLTLRPPASDDAVLPRLDADFPNELEQGRDMMMKKKMLLPLMLLLKLKMKALTPILLAIVGLKATKALVLSKISILLVIGFLVVQLCKKLGMPMPMAMPMPEPMPPAGAYGAPAPAPTDSYAPSGWDSNGNGGNGGGPYSRIWTPVGAAAAASADPQRMAYSHYAPATSSR